MECAERGDLAKYIKSKGKLTEPEACRIFQQLILGLEYLHKAGFAHRDIKPSNILLDEEKNVKITDFGLGNEYSYAKGARLHTACGSPSYAAPEVKNQNLSNLSKNKKIEKN